MEDRCLLLKNIISDHRLNDVEYSYNSEVSPEFLDGRLELLYEFITQRYLIYKRRAAGLPYEDWYIGCNNLFSKYKFTNIFREDDRVSKWLITNICFNYNFSLEERFWRTILFRLYNRIDTAEELHLLDADLWDREDAKNEYLVDQINHDVYTRAFKTLGLKLQLGKYYKCNPRLGPLYFVKFLKNSNNFTPLDSKTQNFKNNITAESLYNWFLQFKGIGSFFAYQLFVDCTYLPECPVSENFFVVAGPGCVRGLNELFKNWGTLESYSDLLFYLKDNLNNLFKELHPDFEVTELFDDRPITSRNFNVMSLENIFCEFSKFLYVRLNPETGKTKQYHYKGGE